MTKTSISPSHPNLELLFSIDEMKPELTIRGLGGHLILVVAPQLRSLQGPLQG